MKKVSCKKIIKKLGGATVVARALNITRPAVAQWDVIPIVRAIQLERLYPGQVTKEQLRPDVFGNESK